MIHAFLQEKLVGIVNEVSWWLFWFAFTVVSQRHYIVDTVIYFHAGWSTLTSFMFIHFPASRLQEQSVVALRIAICIWVQHVIPQEKGGFRQATPQWDPVISPSGLKFLLLHLREVAGVVGSSCSPVLHTPGSLLPVRDEWRVTLVENVSDVWISEIPRSTQGASTGGCSITRIHLQKHVSKKETWWMNQLI